MTVPERYDMKKSRYWVLIPFLMMSGDLSSAQPRGHGEAEQARAHDITPEDYFTIGVINDCEVSPDGRYVVFAESRWDEKKDGRNKDLWITSLDGEGDVKRLTFDDSPDGSPRFCPEGEWLYFTSAPQRAGEESAPYHGKKQVWRIRVNGGEPMAVTREEKGIADFDMTADGRWLFYSVNTDYTIPDGWDSLRKEYGDLEYGYGETERSEIHRLDLVNWRTEKVADPQRYIQEFDASEDGRRLAMLTTPDADLISNEGWSQVDVVDVEGRTTTTLEDRLWREEAPSPFGWLMQPRWSDDGMALAFQVGFDGYPSEILVARWGDLTSGPAIRKLNRWNEVFVTGHMDWQPGTLNLCYTADHRARRAVFRVDDAGSSSPGETGIITPGDVVVEHFDFVGAQSLAVVMSTVTHPPDIYRWSLQQVSDHARPKRITRVNPQVDRWKLPQISIVDWTSPDGTAVHGILELPADYKPGKPLPLMTAIHGGPTASDELMFRFWIYGRTLYAARGWAVFCPNYRGSTGYGDKFLIDLVGHKNDRDVDDILSGIDALVERGIADPDRLAVQGWSNGGYLTNCLIARTNRFKAASSGAGVFDVSMQWGTEDTPGHVVNFQKGLPWEGPARIISASPLYSMGNAKTPTLIHVGENDPRCPPGHSRSLHRALQWYLDVPSQLVIYPGEGHGLTTYKHRSAKMQWDIAWFDRYVLGKGSGDDDEKDPQNDQEVETIKSVPLTSRN
jgi:dipeptidyl aminopeptidase/acylaminoacyl peptidase